MKQYLSPLALTVTALAACACLPARADDSPLMMRVRVVNIDSANKDSTGLGLSLANKVIPEVDLSYFITPNIATELVLTYPQKLNLRSNGAQIGSLKALPPTLSLQYHFTPQASFRPYVGLGVNYTNISDVQFTPATVTALNPGVKHSSYGLSAQAGADIQLDKNLYLNLDLKKVQIGTTVYSYGASVGKFKADPVMFGLGLGWHF